MTLRMMLALILLAIVGLAGVLMFYVSVLPILIGVDLALVLLCALVLALGTGHLQRWIQIVETTPTPVRRPVPRAAVRLLVWPWA